MGRSALARTLFKVVGVDIQPLNLLVEVAAADSRDSRGFRHVAPSLHQQFLDVGALELTARFAIRRVRINEILQPYIKPAKEPAGKKNQSIQDEANTDDSFGIEVVRPD